MMKMNSIRKMLSVILCMVLIAAMALVTTGCGSEEPTPTTQAVTEAATEAAVETAAQAQEGLVSFTVIVTDVEGKQTTFEYSTDKTIVGQVLIEEGLIEGEDGPYGMYIKTVNGLTLDYDKDGKYWAFYQDGEYALTGVDMTEITPGATYELKAE